MMSLGITSFSLNASNAGREFDTVEFTGKEISMYDTCQIDLIRKVSCPDKKESYLVSIDKRTSSVQVTEGDTRLIIKRYASNGCIYINYFEDKEVKTIFDHIKTLYDSHEKTR